MHDYGVAIRLPTPQIKGGFRPLHHGIGTVLYLLDARLVGPTDLLMQAKSAALGIVCPFP